MLYFSLRATCDVEWYNVHVCRLKHFNIFSSFHYSFDFCDIDEEQADKDPPENLGQVVFGERLRASPYKIFYKENQTFLTLCTRNYDLSKGELSSTL